MKKENRKQMVKRLLKEYSISQDACHYYTGRYFEELANLYNEEELIELLERCVGGRSIEIIRQCNNIKII